ncbi:MAG: deoxyribodipyrimidine photo-lyase [Bacteroidota bacterium]
MQTVNIFWFRRDLRLNDNAALYHALKSNLPVLPIFIFDKNILDKLEDKDDRRVTFIYTTILELQQQIKKSGSALNVFYGTPADVFKKLLAKYNINKVFINHDYELYAQQRDREVGSILKKNNATLYSSKDQVIFEKDEVVKDDGKPYTVFTPYSKKWKAKLTEFYLKSYPSEELLNNLYKNDGVDIPTLNEMRFVQSENIFPAKQLNEEIVKKYSAHRDFPGIDGTSKLGVHLRFGTVSIREITKRALALNDTYLNELIWREFYQMILWHFPHVSEGRSFKSEYDSIEWNRDEGEFEKWCKGQTGYPIVDAGMRELNATGFMHNRVRMVVASFLSKHLLLDWRLGEAYFARKLLDFEFASNNGGWQWAAGCGCDAAPYFRIFNPYLQTKKFDPNLSYIKKWVPEFQEFNYPKPIVEHEFARKRALEVYGRTLRKNN